MLLHTCCATCALPIIEYLLTEEKVGDITLYFYNPNIYPEEEYNRRLEDVGKIAKIYKLKLIVGKYEYGKWLDYIKKSLPQSPEEYLENSDRCLNCFRFRLEETVKFAQKNNFDEFATTLSVNRFKNTEFINEYGKSLANKHKIKYKEVNIDFNKAYELGLKLSKKYHLYRQKYCGCEFSIKPVL
ncbi:MAG: epoxyqueuosine reductase QueH [Candidatus Pacebacteria bacterium]|nr:epoxyqueuosine reductase QueH [Candidatus Paceibacterota bacterium]